MACNIDWEEILKDRFVTFKVEETAFIESLQICNSSEIAAEKIYETIKFDEDVPENLILMYKEAVYSENEKVKSRIKNRIANIRRHYRYYDYFTISYWYLSCGQINIL